MLQVKHLKKSFGEDLLWNDLTADFAPSTISAIQGKSGEGKTTFLRCLVGLEDYDEGSISLDGQGLKSEDIGLVFQDYQLFPHMTVLENLLLSSKYKKKDMDLMEKKAMSRLEEMDLLDKKDAYPQALSGGQKQRVAIARACMENPKVLCLDEPTSALDDGSKESIKILLRSLADEGMCILIVTHDGPFAKDLSQKIFHIEEGQFTVTRPWK